MAVLEDFCDLESGAFVDHETGEEFPAEKIIFRAIQKGWGAQVSNGAPQEDLSENKVRASFLRYLALGGCDKLRLKEKGLQVRGAWVRETLDLEGAQIAHPLQFIECRFDSKPIFTDARTRSISFKGSELRRGLSAEYLRADGAVHLHYIEANNEVSLHAARIDGGVRFAGAQIKNARGHAVYLDGARVDGNVSFIRGFHATGTVQLDGARITGSVLCVGATFEAGSRKVALSMRRAEIAETLMMRAENASDPGAYKDKRSTSFKGLVNLRQMVCRSLEDDAQSWPEAGALRLDGLVYRALVGDAPADFASRKGWLLRQDAADLRGNFKPQPFEQLMKVLHGQGHPNDARRIGVLLEDQRRKAGAVQSWLYARTIHPLFGWFAGYGYLTERALYWTIGFLLLGHVIFSAAWNAGAMAPVAAVADPTEEWRECAQFAPNPAACWVKKVPGKDYTSFDPLLYSIDVFLPIVDLSQEVSWSPSPERGWRLGERFGFAQTAEHLRSRIFFAGELAYKISRLRIGNLAYGFGVLHEALGYLLSAFAVAGAARLIRHER